MKINTGIEQGTTAEVFSLENLSVRSDVPVRTIRYYIQRGLVSRPEGEKKGSYYLRKHLNQLLQIRKWVAAGMSLDRIAMLMSPSDVPAPHPQEAPTTIPIVRNLRAYALAPGIELVIDSSLNTLSDAAIKRLLALCESNLMLAAASRHEQKD